MYCIFDTVRCAAATCCNIVECQREWRSEPLSAVDQKWIGRPPPPLSSGALLSLLSCPFTRVKLLKLCVSIFPSGCHRAYICAFKDQTSKGRKYLGALSHGTRCCARLPLLLPPFFPRNEAPNQHNTANEHPPSLSAFRSFCRVLSPFCLLFNVCGAKVKETGRLFVLRAAASVLCSSSSSSSSAGGPKTLGAQDTCHFGPCVP